MLSRGRRRPGLRWHNLVSPCAEQPSPAPSIHNIHYRLRLLLPPASSVQPGSLPTSLRAPLRRARGPARCFTNNSLSNPLVLVPLAVSAATGSCCHVRALPGAGGCKTPFSREAAPPPPRGRSFGTDVKNPQLPSPCSRNLRRVVVGGVTWLPCSLVGAGAEARARVLPRHRRSAAAAQVVSVHSTVRPTRGLAAVCSGPRSRQVQAHKPYARTCQSLVLERFAFGSSRVILFLFGSLGVTLDSRAPSLASTPHEQRGQRLRRPQQRT